MKNRTQITYLALTERELELMRNILTVVPRFAGRCDLVEPSVARGCQVVVVNTDDPRAVRGWNTIRKNNSNAVPLTVSGRSKQCGELQLRRPIQARHLIDAMHGLIGRNEVVAKADVATSDVLNILVVDDSVVIRKHMEYTLPKIDNGLINMSFASSGEEALQKTSKQTYDLVFLDIVMPGINGYNVCKAMKADRIGSVVLLTSKKSSFDKVRGLMSGCDAYITKPPTLAQLREQIVTCKRKREDARRTRIVESGSAVSAFKSPQRTQYASGS